MRSHYYIPAFFILLLSLPFLYACSSESDNNILPAGNNPDQYINATLNDKSFKGEVFGSGDVHVIASSTLGANALQLSATQGNQFLYIYLVGFTEIKATYMMKGLGHSPGDAIAYYSEDNKNWAPVFNVSAGSVEVTSVKDNYVEGIFEFTLEPTAYGSNSPGTGTKVFKKGTFRSKYRIKK